METDEGGFGGVLQRAPGTLRSGGEGGSRPSERERGREGRGVRLEGSSVTLGYGGRWQESAAKENESVENFGGGDY